MYNQSDLSGGGMDEYGNYGQQQQGPPISQPGIRPMVDPEAEGEVDTSR